MNETESRAFELWQSFREVAFDDFATNTEGSEDSLQPFRCIGAHSELLANVRQSSQPTYINLTNPFLWKASETVATENFFSGACLAIVQVILAKDPPQ